MWRWLRFIVLLGAAAGVAVWLAENPGAVTLQWGGWRVDTSTGLLVAAVLVFAVVVALLYRGWLFLRRAPGEIGLSWRGRRRRKGYEALTRGMVAVAAGDADEARRNARRAEELLNDPPLTMLLSAQSAQLDGDERAAEKFFKAMAEKEETAFLGLRGLLTQATKRGDEETALRLARQAYRLRPKSQWVADELFRLQAKRGLWLDARATSDDMARNKLIGSSETGRRRAVLLYRSVMERAAEGDERAALKDLKSAVDQAPDFAPAVAELARRHLAAGNRRKAEGPIQRAWAMTPHPDLAGLYAEARGATDVMTRVKAAEKLAAINPGHLESRLMLARAALDAKLWGEARSILSDRDMAEADGRVYRLMAELEESENGDAEAARRWLIAANQAAPESAWVCGDCGNAVPEWSAHCAACGGFDTFRWDHPRRILVGSGDEKPALPATTESADAQPKAVEVEGEAVALIGKDGR